MNEESASRSGEALMKERGILFKGPMVRAILAGSKTQTRRIIKPQPPARAVQVSTWHHPDEGDGRGKRFYAWVSNPPMRGLFIDHGWCMPCPLGAVEDRLWTRETWGRLRQFGDIVYRADDPLALGASNPWHPAIHMFRKDSRITLEITEVRAQRLQDISAEDAAAEGLMALTKDGKTVKYGIPDMDGLPGNDDDGWPWEDWRISPVDAYRKLWESINGPGSWSTNPWVWAITFRRID